MSKAYKAGPSKAARTAPPGATSHRLNLRAVICLVVAVPLSVGGLFAWKVYSGRANLSHYLAEAKRALDDKQPEMALTYVGYYLQGDPKNLEALEIKGRALAEVARDLRGVEEAIRVQTQILALDPERMAARKRLIELNLRGGLFRAAQAAAEDYLNRGADDAEAHRLMARALEGVGYYLSDTKALDGDPEHPDAPFAIAEFEKAEKLQPGDVDGGSRLAEIYVSRGKDPARAVEVMDKILETNPKAIAARLARLRFFIRHPELAAKSGESRKVRPKETLAEHELDEALKLAPGDVEAGLIAAEAALNAGDTAGARARLAAIQPPPKDDLRVNLIKGMIEFREQRLDEGIQSWRAGLIQTGGTSADLNWRLARVLIGLNRLGEARQHMAQYRRLSGGSEPNPEYRYLEALLYLRTGRIKEALPILEALRDRTGRTGLLTPAHHLITLGDAYAAARDEARALDTYGQATHLAGAGPQPWTSMARIHQLAERQAEAIAALEGGLAAAPDDTGLLVALAQILRQQELAKPKDARNWTELRRRLEQAEGKAPGSPDVALIRADLLADEGRLDDALKGIETIVARVPTAVGPWLARISALTRLGRLDEALDATDAAIKAAGDHAQFRVAKARLLDRRGEPRGAYEALAEGMDRVPPDQRPQLRRALGEFHQGRNDFEAARRDYEEWARLQPESYEPRLALLNLANQKQDGPAMEAQVAALRQVVGPDAVIGKVVRAQVLLNLKPRSDDGRSGEDKARLDEVAKLAAEIKAAAPRAASGPLIEAQLMARLGRADAEIAAYKAALELRGGQAALKPLVMLLSKPGREREYEELRKKAPAFPAEFDQIASALMLQRGDTAGAEQLADRMVQGDPQGLDAAVWKAKLLNTVGKPDEAEKALRFFADQQPDNPSAWIQLLMFQASRGEAEKARATLDRMKGQPRLNTERPELIWAACYRVLNMRPEADEEFAKALKRWPDDPGVNQVAIDYYETTGRPELAEAALRHLLKVRPGFDWARRRLALNLSAKPNSPEALSEAMSLVDASSGADSPEDRQLRAVVLARSADPKHRGEAIAILEALAAEVPEASRGKLHEALARSLIISSEQARAAGDEALAAADRAKAVEHAAKAVAPENAPADVVLFHAILRLQDKAFAEVEKDLARLVKTDAKALATVELRARLLHAEGKDAESEAQILGAFEARKAAPDALTAGIGLLRVLMSMNRDDAAERLGAELAKLNARGQIAFAEYLAGRGKAKEARDLLDAASKAGAGADAARAAVAMASERGGEWTDHADDLLRRALNGKSDQVDLLLSQAHLRHLRRDYPAEVELYKGIVAKNPNGYLFLNNMAWTLSEEMGRPEEGIGKIDEAIAKAGRQSHLVDTRGVILLRLGRVDEAIKDLEAAVVTLPTAPIYLHMARAYKKAGREADFEKYRGLARKAGLRPEQLQLSERDEAEKLVGFPAAKPAADFEFEALTPTGRRRRRSMPKRVGPYWTDARFTLEVHEPGAAGPRLVPVGRPFALIGRIAHAELRFEDRDVSARHVYLHADARGLFAVDLATRTGTRFGEAEAPCGWLRPGESIEVAGRAIRLAAFEVGGRPVAPPPCAVNLLTDAGEVPLAGLTLEPVAGRGPSWALGSELAFVGRGDGCAIRLNQANVSRTHCALLRTARDAYVIDLPGQPTLVNGQPPRGATALRDGDVLSIGQVRFVARVAPPAGLDDEGPGPPFDPGQAQSHDLVRIIDPSGVPGLMPSLASLPVHDGRPFPIDLIPPESRGAVLGWMLGALHAGQSEMIRRQDELQESVVAILRHLQTDSAARHASQEERIDRLAEELRRLAAPGPALPAPDRPHHAPPPPSRPAQDLPPAPEIDPARSLATAAWLLERIDKVGTENKSTLKSLFARLGASPRKAEAPANGPGSASRQPSASEDERGGGA